MPSRANQMAAGDVAGMMPQRFGAMNMALMEALTNKKAYEDAFRKHKWESEKLSKEAIRKEREEYNAHKYKMKEIGARNEGEGKSNLEYQVLTQAVKMAQESGIDMDSPEGQQEFQSIYQALLSQATGGKQGAMKMASGQTLSSGPKPEVPNPVGALNPMRVLPGYADYGVKKGSGQKLDKDTAGKILQKAGGDKDKARAMARKLGYTF